MEPLVKMKKGVGVGVGRRPPDEARKNPGPGKRPAPAVKKLAASGGGSAVNGRLVLPVLSGGVEGFRSRGLKAPPVRKELELGGKWSTTSPKAGALAEAVPSRDNKPEVAPEASGAAEIPGAERAAGRGSESCPRSAKVKPGGPLQLPEVCVPLADLPGLPVLQPRASARWTVPAPTKASAAMPMGLGTTSSTLAGAIDAPKPCSDKRDVTTVVWEALTQPPIEYNMLLQRLAAVLILVFSVSSQRVAPGVPPQQYQQASIEKLEIRKVTTTLNKYLDTNKFQFSKFSNNTCQFSNRCLFSNMCQFSNKYQFNNNMCLFNNKYQFNNNNQFNNNTCLFSNKYQFNNNTCHFSTNSHIQEHMEVPMDTSKMTEQELQFHYFKMHDADNNNKLDGSELIKSLIHWHEQGHQDPNNPTPQGEKIFTDEELLQLIDPILNMDDGNNDGYIDYPEFVRAQQKAAANTAAPRH
uniref:EF-hand domain-containing protein n=1 Tax=Timema douglasi TaxID=61478 RepID=A0A7R8VK56_TIMDO|nr:unnamed protein product [Timema douglasi]